MDPTDSEVEDLEHLLDQQSKVSREVFEQLLRARIAACLARGDRQAVTRLRGLQRELRRPTPVGVESYHYPMELVSIDRALGGRRHGRKHELAVQPEVRDATTIVKITIEAPRGAQIELGLEGTGNGIGRVTADRCTDFGPEGRLLPSALMRMVNRLTGPCVSRMGHVAFYLAVAHAAREGRPPDGRFYYSPTEVADLLGYGREACHAPRGRISKVAIKTVRRDFETYAATRINTTLRTPNGDGKRTEGTLLYPTSKQEITWRRRGRAGRDRKIEFRIRDEFWELVRRHYVILPADLLRAHGNDPRVWAKCIRIAEVLYAHARNNAKNLAGQPLELTLTLQHLVRESNVFGEHRAESRISEDLLACLERLEGRGHVTFEQRELKDGRPGIAFALPPARMAELAALGARARARRKLG